MRFCRKMVLWLCFICLLWKYVGCRNHHSAYCDAVKVPVNGKAVIIRNTGSVVRTPSGLKNRGGTVIKFWCNEGYALQGSEYIKCLSSGHYNSTAPLCKAALVCSNPSYMSHLLIPSVAKTNYASGEIISVSCNTGYELKGSKYLRCLSNGHWNDSLPICERKRCPVPAELDNSVYTIDQSSYCSAHNNEQLHYQCNIIIQCAEGFVLNNCSTSKIRCLESGLWSQTQCRCEKRKCPYPEQIRNGIYQFINGTQFNGNLAEYETMIVAKCDTGYGILGGNTMTCKSDGRWSGLTPFCRALICSHPGSFRHGYYTLTNGSKYNMGIEKNGLKIFVNCFKGYENVGNGERICTNWTWTGEKPVCSIINCNYPGHFSNGFYTFLNRSIYVISTVEYGSVIYVNCYSGYENLEGNRRTCQFDKTWSGKNPLCTIIHCSHPGYFPNGVYTHSNGSKLMNIEFDYGTTLFVRCNNGFVDNGQRYRTCTTNKTWSGNLPICNIVKCKHPGRTAVENGHYKQDNGYPYMNGLLNFSKAIEVVCVLGFSFSSGSKYRTCLTNGTWSGQDAKCTKVTCTIPNATEGITYHPLVKEVSFRETVNVSCDNGFNLRGSSLRQCREDGELDGGEPVCEEITLSAQSSKQSAITGSVIGVVVFLLVASVILAISIYWRRRLNLSHAEHQTNHNAAVKKQSENGEYAVSQEMAFNGAAAKNDVNLKDMELERINRVYTNAAVESEHAYYSFDRPPMIPKTAIMLNELSDLVLKGMEAKERFKKEFKGLPVGLQETCSVAMKLQNRDKNKYKNIYAYDQTRVLLEKGNTNSSDYINASYIHGFNKVKAYVASQGPLDNTKEDFWRMIWQTKGSKLVMLTNLTEEGKKKCEQYWPEKGNLTYGDITVTLKKKEIFTEFIIRNLTMQKGKGETHDVTQFHFTAWPDKGVPKYASSLVKFRSKVKQEPVYREGPVVVHCSAGIGRTGTFIAIDYLTDQANAMNYIDVAGTVETLRKQRVNMVQTLEQYIFVHHAVVETLMLPSSGLPASQFPQVFRNLLSVDMKSKKRKIDLDYEMLKKLSPVPEESQYISANHVRNRQKNRYSDILPVEDFMPPLTSEDGRRTDYVNAVYLPSYKEKKAFIITQTPLETTREDFWRLVWEQNIHTVVMMNNFGEMMETEIYWPKDGEMMKYGSINVLNEGTEELSQHTVVSLTVRKNQTQRSISQFQFSGWSSDNAIPESPESVLSLMEIVQKWQQQTENHTVLVHCMNGAEKSGLFCVISAVIERMKIEQDVAISHVIEEMRNAREQIIPTVEQYQFCHEAVLAFMQQFETYSNFSI